MKKIFITRQIPDNGINMLKDQGYEVDISDKDGVLTADELIEKIKAKPYDAVLCLLTDKIDSQVFEAAPEAKIFANYAVGFDNIDIEEAKKREVIITNTPGILTEAVAEFAVALIMATSKRVVEADSFTKAGKYEGWAPMLFLGMELKGKTLGIIGTGRIGSRVARKAAFGFDMKVIYYDISRNEDLEKESAASFRASVEEVLKEADIVSIHVPLLDSTRHLINKERLSLMKPTAVLVNTSRGPVIDEEALVEALKNNIIRGAGLDVLENEPELSPGLAELSNVVVTPHIASATEEARQAMSEAAAKNIIEVLEGREPISRVG